MSRTGLRGMSRAEKRYVSRQHLFTPSDLVSRQFTADEPNQLSGKDIPENPIGEGKVDYCCVIDVHCRRVVGRVINTDLETNFVVSVLKIAIEGI